VLNRISLDSRLWHTDNFTPLLIKGKIGKVIEPKQIAAICFCTRKLLFSAGKSRVHEPNGRRRRVSGGEMHRPWTSTFAWLAGFNPGNEMSLLITKPYN
jgi:hypothetical protein